MTQTTNSMSPQHGSSGQVLNYDSAKKLFWIAVRTVCPHFEVNQSNINLLKGLVRYFARDPIFEFGSLRLDKGIFLAGNPGAGKSMLMQVFRALVRQSPWEFRYISVRDALNNFNISGSASLSQFSKDNWFFDDLGIEPEGKHFGDSRELFSEIIALRYELFTQQGLSTHFTTMLTREEIKARYGEFIDSRLRQMCNTMPPLFNSPDYRENSAAMPPLDKVWENLPKFFPHFEEEKYLQRMLERQEMLELYQIEKEKAAQRASSEGLSHGEQVREALYGLSKNRNV